MNFGLLVRRWTLCGALAAVVMLTAAASATAASGPSVWGPITPYIALPSGGGDALFTSVACASAGNCVAVGFDQMPTGQAEGLVAAESSGTWGPATALAASVLPSNAGSSPFDQLMSVSCAGAGSCEAVGSYQDNTGATQALAVPIDVSGPAATPGQGVEVTLPAGAESSQAQSAALNGVSCQGSGGCVAVGEYMDSFGHGEGMIASPGSGGAWAATELTELPLSSNSDPEVRLNSVSCPGSGDCEAVGTYIDGASDQQPLAVTVSDDAPGRGIEVNLPGDYTPTQSTGSGILAEVTALTSVSCPSAGICTASGSYTTTFGTTQGLSAVAVPIDSGTPGTAVGLQLPEGVPTRLALASAASISCTDASDCSLVGYAGPPALIGAVTGAEVGGAWSPLTALPSTSPDAGLSAGLGISCAAVAPCEAVGVLQIAPGSGPVTGVPFTAASLPPLTVTTTSLPAAQVGTPYAVTLQAAGGSGTNAWSIGPGALPAGLTLDPSTGVISGTPTANGQSGFVVTDADAGPPAQNASTGLSITVAAGPTSPATMPVSTPTAPMSQPTAPMSQPTAPMSQPTPSVTVAYLNTLGKKATVVLTCAHAACTGKLAITAVERHKGKAITAVAAMAKNAKTTTKTTTLASGRYSIAAGGAKATVLTLSKGANTLLSQLHKLSGELTVTPAGASHPAVIKIVKFTTTSK